MSQKSNKLSPKNTYLEEIDVVEWVLERADSQYKSWRNSNTFLTTLHSVNENFIDSWFEEFLDITKSSY